MSPGTGEKEETGAREGCPELAAHLSLEHRGAGVHGQAREHSCGQCPGAKAGRSRGIFRVGIRSPGVASVQSVGLEVAGKRGRRGVWDKNVDGLRALPGSVDMPLEAVTGKPREV